MSGCDFQEVTAARVSRHFGRRWVLRDVCFSCRAGEVVGLLGANGAGKSTLLNVLSTLLRPAAGEVRYGALTAAEAGAALRGHLGLLGHDLQLYPELTAAENLAFFARVYAVKDVAGGVARALAAARLEDRRDDAVSGFSRGMRQRLALERALLHGPRLVLLDEPFTGLDRGSAEALKNRLRQLAAEGRIVLLATHDLDLAEGLLDRALLLRGGRLRALARDTSWREAYTAALTAEV